MSPISTIHELIKAARAGDNASWNILYKHYHPGLYAIALQRCANIHIAQDMVQDAFITAYLKLNQLKDVTAFGGWIKKILVHTCYRASRSTRANHSLDLIPSQIERWCEDELNKAMDSVSTTSSLYSSLAALPEILRSTLLLRYFSTFQSYEEIAMILSVPVGTVRSRLNQARLKLAEQWKQSIDADPKILKQGESWNNFYYNTLSGIHHHDDYKNQFISHLCKDVQIIAGAGKPAHDGALFERMIHDDRQAGSWLSPVNIMSSGNISIVESRHFNSPEHPDHCPIGSIMIIHRYKEKVSKIQLQPLRN